MRKVTKRYRLWLTLEILGAIGLVAGLVWYYTASGTIGLIQGVLIAFIGWAIVEWMGDTLFPGLMPRKEKRDGQDK